MKAEGPPPGATPGQRLRVGVETSVASFDAAGTGRYSREIVRALRKAAPLDVEIVEIAPRKRHDVSRRGWRRTAFVLYWELVYCRYLLPKRVRDERIDLLHCTAPLPLRARFPVRVVTTIHDAILFSHPEWFPRVRLWRTRRWWRRAARSVHVLASSQATRKALNVHLGVEEGRSTVVLLGTDISPVPHAVPSEPFLLTVGTLEPRKNLAAVLESVALLKERRGRVPRLYVVGGAGWGGVRLAAAVDRLGLRNDVTLLGFVPDDQLAELYTTALALLYLSLDEGFGFPPLEAMACGCPVIASNAASIPEVVGDAGLLVDPRDTGQIADTIDTLLTNPALARTLRDRGRRRANGLRWADCARATLDVYRKVVA